MVEREPLIPKHGEYRKLKGFQVAQLVYDVAVPFVEKYIDRFSRTRDQMVQAVRSGVQNWGAGLACFSEGWSAMGALERSLRGHAISSEFQAGIKEEDEVIHESN